MASRAMSNVPPYTFGLLEKRIAFRIMANGAWTSPIAVAGRGSNAIVAGAGNAMGVTSVTRLSAGKFQVNLDDSYAKLVMAQATYQGSGDAEDISAQLGVIANLGVAATTPVTVIVKTKTGTVNTDPATTDVNTSINVDLVFEDSGA